MTKQHDGKIEGVDAAKARIIAALENGFSKSNLRGMFWEEGKRVYRADKMVIMPTTLDQLRTDDPKFSETCKELLAKNRKAAHRAGVARSAARRRAMTRCGRGHELVGGNVVMGRRNDGRVYRTCLACHQMSFRRGGAPATFDEMQQFARAIREGATITDLTRGGSPLRLMNHAKVLTFRRDNPSFDRMIVELSAANAQVKRVSIVRAPRIVHRASEAMAAINAAVPRYLLYTQRQEVIAAMALAYADGRLRFNEISTRVREFLAGENRQFGRYRPGGLAPVSLDRPLFEDSSMTLGDTVTHGLWG